MELKEGNNPEEYYAVVCWKDKNGKSRIVGTLAYFEGKYYFKYEQAAINEILDEDPNFTGIGGFALNEELRISENALFTFFQLRVPPEIKNKPEALKVLIEKRGRIPTDGISVMPVPKTYQPAVKAEIMGLERKQNEQKNYEDGIEK